MLNNFVAGERLVFGGMTVLSAYQLTRFGALSKSGKFWAPVGLGVGIAGFMIANRCRSVISILAKDLEPKEAAPVEKSE